MALKTLSAFPYYGGKAKMASLICDMLDYKHTDTFVTPFGGACRVLLNKPRHAHEFYGDLSNGLCTFVSLMSDQHKSQELIHRIYETEYSEEKFKQAKNICDVSEKGPLLRMKQALKDFLKSLSDKYGIKESKRHSFFTGLGIDSSSTATDIDDILNNKLTIEENNRLHDILNEISYIENFEKESGYIPLSRDYEAKYVINEAFGISDMDLAVATYVRYMQSRDAMGKVWSNSKFRTTDGYYNQMSRLYQVAERLEGVKTFHTDAKFFCSDYAKKVYKWEQDWLSRSNVMMLCDPSYIDPVSEKKYLELLEQVKNGRITKEKAMKNRPKNLGTSYEASFTYEDHEAFVKSICKANCKMIVCNYDLVLYDNYLNAENKWKRIEFETTTSVGGKKDNKRTEVLWYKNI